MDVLNQKTAVSLSSVIKGRLAEESAEIRRIHFSGAGGNEVVQRRTGLIDRVLREVYADVSSKGRMPSLIAIGGYGRGELNPYSDIDILFLCRDEDDRSRAPDLLYVLWDAGLDIGYSVRTIKECVSLARQDIKIRTSLLESRFIAGDRGLYSSFLQSMKSDVFYWKSQAFITEKIVERNATRRKYGGSIYLREPNIKEGEGGLRDLHTALWIAFVHFRINSLDELVSSGVITHGQYAVFLRSRNFLWRIRNELHYLSMRKNDHMTFDLQERAALDFRYRDSAHLYAVERFMKAYFLHARTIREFSNIVVNAVLPGPTRRWYHRRTTLGAFSLVGRTLFLSSDQACTQDNSLVLRAFELVQSHHAAFSEHLRDLIKKCRIDDTVRTSPAAARSFLAILDNLDGLSETLNLMKDLRFLGRYLPEFRAIQALARHDYYHLYTVDEHILLAVKKLQDLWNSSHPGPVTLSDALMGLNKKWVLILALLLHDLGKAFRHDHEQKGTEIAGAVLERMGIRGEDRERILFLIKNHLVMASLSQRRELSDRKVIADFSQLVRDRENLAMLYLLTYADISSVNPQAWTQWKAVLLQDLYVKTLNYIEKKALVGEEDKARLASMIVKIKEAAQGKYSSEMVTSFLSVMSDQYILSTSVNKILDHIGMLLRLPQEQLVIEHRHYPEKGYTELTVCAYDAYGMFYRTAGTIASKNLNILRAQVYTSKSGVMFDTFQITDSAGKLYEYEDAWKSVHQDLRNVLMNKTRWSETNQYPSVPRITTTIPPEVEFDNLTSDAFTIIDISTRDRVGLLYQVTKSLYELNLDIASAKIVTEGSRVMDSFYVSDLLRRKVTDPDRLGKIKETLLAVLKS
jgi:[protein-PII] uridylyltransferase